MKTKTKTIHLKNLFFVVCMFFALFLPPLTGISMTYIMTAVMAAYLVFHYLRKRVVSIKMGYGLRLLSFFVPFFVYLLIQVTINYFRATNSIEKAAYLDNLTGILLAAVYCVISYLFFLSYYTTSKAGEGLDWSDLLFYAVLIQVALVFCSYFSNTIHDFFIHLFLTNSRNDIFTSAVSRYNWRTYGFAGFYFDSLSFLLSTVSIMAIMKAFEQKKSIYYVSGFLIFLSSILGSRTGIVLFLSGFLVVVVFQLRKRNVSDIIKWGVIIGLSVLVLVGFVSIAMSDQAVAWLKSGIKSIVSILRFNTNESTFDEILGRDLVFPKNIIFGLGAKPETLDYYDRGGRAIDNGYVQFIWRFGVLGLVLFVIGMIRFYRAVFRGAKDYYSKGIIVILVVLLAFYFVKLYPITFLGIDIVYFVFPAIVCVTSNMKENENA